MMEEVLSKTLSENIQEAVNGSQESQDEIELKPTLPSTRLNAKEETSQGLNGHVDIASESSGESEIKDELPQHKTYSPTLIESAFKVMKNLFSPDKTKSKPQNANPVKPHQSSSESPSSSTCLPSKTEFTSADAGVENSLSTQTGDNSVKNQLNVNQVGVLFSPLALESHNNTDESFLTTVSIIDDSFHSAITNLDENGENAKLETHLLDNYLNNTQNSDVGDPYNDTLENTTLRNGSFTSDVSKMENLTILSRDGSGESWNNSQVNGCSRNSLDNYVELPRIEIHHEAVNDQHCNNTTKVIDKLVDGQLVNNGRLKDEYVNGVISEENSSESLMQAVTHDKKMEDIFLNRSFDTCKSTSSSLGGSAVPTDIYENEALNGKKQRETCFEGDEQDVSVENSISTTTVVLNSVDIENILVSLKDDLSATTAISSQMSIGSSTNTESTLFGNIHESELFKELDQFQPFESVSLGSTLTERNSFPLHEPQRNVSSVSETKTSPIALKVNKIKSYKSDELLNRRSSTESPEGKRTMHKKKSSLDVSLIKHSEASENASPETNSEFPENFGCSELNVHTKENIRNQKQVRGTEPKTPTGVSVISQQSYTILTNDNSLKRPVIESANVGMDFPEEQTFQTPDSKKACSAKTMPAEDCVVNTSLGGANSGTPSHQKHSTPLRKENVRSSVDENRQKLANTTASLDLSTPKDSTADKRQIEYPSVTSKAEESEKKNQTINSNDCLAEFSPVNPVNENGLIFSNSVDSESEGSQFSAAADPNATRVLSNDRRERNRTPEAKRLAKKSQKTGAQAQETVNNMNKTFDKKPTQHTPKSNLSSEGDPGCEKLNATFNKNSDFPLSGQSNKTFTKETESSGSKNKNQTFVVSGSPESNEINKTFNKTSFGKGFEKKGGSRLNETFDKRSLSPVIGRTDDSIEGKSGSPVPNQTFVKEKNSDDSKQNKQDEINKTFEVSEAAAGKKAEEPQKGEEGKVLSKETRTDKPSSEDKSAEQNLDQQASDYIDGCHRDMNGSFISGRSSNASLAGSELSTLLLNEDPLSRNQSMEDLAGKLSKLNLNVSQDGSQVVNVPMFTPTEEQMPFSESVSLLDDKMKCDPYLVQLIQEQFSSNEIEKICSVVDDLSATKLSTQILKASEQFDKSFHENLSSAELKPPEPETKPEKFSDPLSPKSFDFLSSIQGKPTGRDWSRESLYVKFDPLVQPNPNSLIDFTKEAEALPAEEKSPAVPHDSSVCEQLLAISPQKKPDDIVPPLTPLSHKSKADKMERIKELQNEIYFLKNLYSERERTNKTKMEDYESQVAKLTGETCFLENKLKESNEREKALVKKMKEQAQSLGQLKIIMEEYMKVISKLTSELEALKTESQKQIEALSSEKDSYMTHLQNTEAAFTDVHAKYEKSKKTIVGLKSNEAMFRNTIAEQTQKMEEFKAKAKEAQEKAFKEFQKIQEELSESKTSHSQETARLRAQLRKTELKVEALQESLEQKIKENQQLTAICDELIEGKK